MSTRAPQRGAAKRSALVIAGAVAVALYILLRASTVVVGAGHRGVVFSRSAGVRATSLDEGLHFIVPLVWDVRQYSVRSLTYTTGAEPRTGEIPGGEPVDALSSDGQKISMHISLRFHLDPGKVWQVHRDLGEDYVAKIIKPELRSEARMAVAAYPGIELYSTARYALQEAIQKRLTTKLAAQSIVVEQVLIRDIILSAQFQHAIEQKQIAQQDALRMDYVVKKQQEEKKQAIILAEGEARAIELKGHALASYPELVQWEYVNGLPPDVEVVVTDTDTI
ncbi:MAG: prohibitin family protein, partial [Armatimonadetes bacterium]|nr:prohibitin family protein [Armatimonadota bacterium]